MNASTPAHRRFILTPFTLACSPLVLGLLWILLLRPEAGAVGAILLGPWAGIAYGHQDCTMGTILPLWSALCAALLLPIALLAFARPRHLRDGWVLSLFALWGTLWSGLALLSVVNTLA